MLLTARNAVILLNNLAIARPELKDECLARIGRIALRFLFV